MARGKTRQPQSDDPYRDLCAAILLQALKDARKTPSGTSIPIPELGLTTAKAVQMDARAFLTSTTAHLIMYELGLVVPSAWGFE